MAIRKRFDSAIVDVWKREVGDLSIRKFFNRRAAAEDLVLRLDILRKLYKHGGCVNTISFNASGDILVSGSDDKKVILWDWETGQVNLSFYSGHEDNVFQAKIMPYTDDRSIVTCAADGQVRHAQILERGGVETKLLAKHQGRAHKLAVEPGSPHIFYTCGEDGLVQHIDLRTGTATGLFTCKSVPGQNFSPTIHLNTITIDPRNPNLFAVGGTDQFARLYDIRQYKWDGSSEYGRPVDFFCAPHLISDDDVGITGLSFSEQSELLVSYNNEFIYLFTKDIGLGPEPNLTPRVSDSSETGDDVKATPQDYKGHKNFETVKGVGFFGPNCDYVVSGSDCGRIFIWKRKGGELVRVMEADKYIVNCIEAHPHATVLASSGIEHNIKMWTPKATETATLPTNIQKDRATVNLIPHRIGFFPFGVFYDHDEEEDELLGSDDEFNNSDDDDDVSDDDDSTDDDDVYNPDYDSTDSDSENEVLNREYLEVEENNNEGDDNIDCTVFGDADDNDDDYIENEVSSEHLQEEENNNNTAEKNDGYGSENISDEDEVKEEMSLSENDDYIDNSASDESFVDICDVDNHREFSNDDDGSDE
ncbi:hypothetical protein CASFOL_036322 [Castilleja foliolosa]|uniref:Uncharacterized protein n=1 Tax=Castilleja foliolosa TaxID=1961234 RepID=A0ABD3BVA5_9LAMI